MAKAKKPAIVEEIVEAPVELEITGDFLLKLVTGNKVSELRKLINEAHIFEIADKASLLEPMMAAQLIRMLKTNDAADLFSYMEPDVQEKIIAAFTTNELAKIFETLDTDEAVDIIEEMPGSIVKKIYEAMDKETHKDVLTLLKYEKNMVGAIMTIDVITLDENWTVRSAINFLRKNKQAKKEVDYYLYVLDKETSELKGYITMEQLIIESEKAKLKNIMKPPIYVKTREDREVALEMFRDYEITSLAVIDSLNKFVGIVTSTAAIEVAEEELEEDIQKAVGISPIVKSYSKSTSVDLYKSRFFWVFILLITGTVTQIVATMFTNFWGVSSSIVGSEFIISTAITTAVTVVSVISGASGNAGSQSASTITRSLSNGEIDPATDMGKTFRKEMGSSSLMALTLALANYARMILVFLFLSCIPITNSHIQLWGTTDSWTFDWDIFWDYNLVALITSIAFFASIIVAGLMGALAPIIAIKYKKDPAAMAGPLVSSIIDLLSMVIYYVAITLLIYIVDSEFLGGHTITGSDPATYITSQLTFSMIEVKNIIFI